jgi:hypothetical protein
VAVFGAGNIASVEVKGTTATLTGLRDDITYDVTVTVRTYTFSLILQSSLMRFQPNKRRSFLFSLTVFFFNSPVLQARTQKGRGPSIKASTSPFGGSSHLNSASSLINGHFALVPATGRDWKCSPEPSISICPAAAARLCNPMTCADVAKRGLCDTPFMRQTDWQKKMVTQFCSDECRCAATPTLRQTLAGPAPDACCDIQTAEYFIDEYGRSTNDIHR